MSKEKERILKLKEDMTNEQWLSSQLRLNLEREEGRLEEREKIWGDLLNVINKLNISIYKRPIQEETNNFIKYFRKEIENLIKRYKMIRRNIK